MRKLKVAAVQMACGNDRDQNVARAEALVRQAVAEGAGLVLLPALFEMRYFGQEQSAAHFNLARPFEGHPLIARMSRLAAELDVVLPISFFERANNAFFSTVAIIDADGTVMGIYRKSHIPDGPCCEEKFYFTPGDTGFRIWRTRHGVIGVGICTDQWYPECARSMAVMGAEILLFPTVQGGRPQEVRPESVLHWHRVIQGHASANLMPIISVNRHGLEMGDRDALAFQGGSLIVDEKGNILASAGREGDQLLTYSFDLDALAAARASSGLFRDRRPDLYLSLLTLDGRDQMF
ncbi:N-carbamoylputrescine amidase [Arboricoccus pini]|uniref:N-carbamoylputrescine amidase n=1 Tax=Arboricoccus pini TaxID=1963835 RepID=A0A212RCZ1_9PROT|nr:nitrilase-related carbon-nitrogen hydrolase [Arboricoccus pini]SNB70142.1 N-carbamoylputrescine amidase [Arboricoccus pini]